MYLCPIIDSSMIKDGGVGGELDSVQGSSSMSVTVFSFFYPPALSVTQCVGTQPLKITRGNDLANMAENLTASSVCMGGNRTVHMRRTKYICAPRALSRQVGWEGFDGSNLILDRKHPSPYVKVENFSSKTSGAWGLGLVMDFLHLRFLKLFDICPNLKTQTSLALLSFLMYVCMCLCSHIAV